jgi:DNA-binding Lrp family transcriptional regulator
LPRRPQVLDSLDDLSVSALQMVVKAYVLVQSQLGRARSVAKAMTKVRGVKMVHAVTGVYDVIVYLELPDMASLSELVIRKIQPVKGVERTHTAIVV